MIDHGMTLVHDMHGEPLHYAHEVSIGFHTSAYALNRKGYHYSHDWLDRQGKYGTVGKHYALYIKTAHV